MRAPDEFRTKYNTFTDLRQYGTLDTPATHQCKGCPAWFDHRTRGGNIFHSTKCKARFTQNLRYTIRHVKAHLTPSPSRTCPDVSKESVALAAKLLDELPGTETGCREMILCELNELDKVMDKVGPAHPTIRRSIRAHAT